MRVRESMARVKSPIRIAYIGVIRPISQDIDKSLDGHKALIAKKIA